MSFMVGVAWVEQSHWEPDSRVAVKTFQPCMEPDDSLLCSQEPVTALYLIQMNPVHNLIPYFFNLHYNISFLFRWIFLILKTISNMFVLLKSVFYVIRNVFGTWSSRRGAYLNTDNFAFTNILSSSRLRL
jgi:hypothetical protein